MKSELWPAYTYNSRTGVLSRDKSSQGRCAGPIGSENGNGYLTFGDRGKVYRVNIVCWEIYHNKKRTIGWVVHHKNGNKTDNRIANLELTSKRVNNQNKKTHREGKLVGASYHTQTGKYRAQAIVDGKKYSLGLHSTERAAHLVYMKFLKEKGLM